VAGFRAETDGQPAPADIVKHQRRHDRGLTGTA
jgi:hypothetical protein